MDHGYFEFPFYVIPRYKYSYEFSRMAVSGYKDHTRTPGFNAGILFNDWEPKKLEHDRDIEFWIDPMDIDETNLTLSVANIPLKFMQRWKAIPAGLSRTR